MLKGHLHADCLVPFVHRSNSKVERENALLSFLILRLIYVLVNDFELGNVPRGFPVLCRTAAAADEAYMCEVAIFECGGKWLH